MKDNLTLKQRAFVNAALETMNPSEAYRRVYDASKMKEATINRKAFEVMRNGKVAAAIKEGKAQTESAAIFGAVETLREWVDIATADPNKLMQHRWVACRFCHGVKHKYHWKDAHEYALALAAAMDVNADRARPKVKLTPLPLPTDEGGYGFNKIAKPHPECPECRGEGVHDVWMADTNTLTGKERKLYAGVKKTKNGIELITRDQDGALANIAKVLGMFVEKMKIVPPGDPDMPALPSDPMEAARVYQKFLNGGT